MKFDPELERHLRGVRLPADDAGEQAPAGFVARVLAGRDERRRLERERAFAGVAGVAAVLSLALLGWVGHQGSAAAREPACVGWMEMESNEHNPWQ